MNPQQPQPNPASSTPSKEQTSFNAIREHSYNFGLAHAVTDANSRIVFKDGAFWLHFTPVKYEDQVWHGDCATDVALTITAVSDAGLLAQATPQAVMLASPDVQFQGTHFRISVSGLGLLEHSLFYSSLDASQIRQVQNITGGGLRPGLEMPGSLNISKGNKSYREFQHSGELYLTSICVRPEEQQALMQVCIYKQNALGLVVRRDEVNCYFNPRNPKSTQTLQHFVIDVQNSDSPGQSAPRITTEIEDTINELFAAYQRGLVYKSPV